MWLLWLMTLAAGPEPLARHEFEELPAERRTAGLSGSAYVGGSDAGLPLPTGGLSLEAGSLSIWVKPLDWRGDDSFYHYFVTMKLGRAGYWLLYKNSSPGTGLFYGWDPDEAPARRFNRSKSIADWTPGSWHHLVATWLDQDRIELYLDGRRVGIGRGIDLPAQRLLPANLVVGQGQVGHPGRTALDDLRLYSRVLLPSEVLELYAEHAEPAAVAAAREALPPPGDPPGLRVSHAALDHRLLVALRADSCGPVPIAAAELEVVGANGEVVARQRLEPTDGRDVHQVDTSGWPLGRYTARLALRDAGGALLGEVSRAFEVPTRQTWAEAAALGVEPAIPPPYQPLRVSGAEISAAESLFRLGDDGFPASLRAAGEELLAAPVQLEVEGLVTRPAPAAAIAATPAAATRSGGLLTEAGRIELTSRLEFDGFAWFEVKVPAEVAARCQAIRLAIPFRRSAARYLNALLDVASAHDRIKGYHLLPPGDGRIWSEAVFSPAIWVGNDQRGLGWFAESDEHWQPAGPAATLDAAGDTVTLRLNLRVGAGAGPLTYGFGLQPTPARPLAPDWRTEQWLSSADITRYFLALQTASAPAEAPLGKVAYLYNYNEFCNTLPNNPELFARQVEEARRRGLYPAPYTDILFHSEGSAEAALHRQAIEALPGARFASSPVAGISTLPVGKGADHYVWFIHHLIERYGLNGLYIDEAWVHPVTGPAELGMGYTAPDGKRRATWPLRARREMLRRIRNLYAAAGRPFRILLHLSAARVPPFLSFGDHLLLGEEFYTLVSRDPVYAHSLTPERLRSAFLAGSSGLPTVVLPQFKASGARMADPKLARGFLSVVLPHDLVVWPLFIHTATVDAARQAMMTAGVGQAAEFVGYWDARPPAKAPAGILVSAWRTAPGKAVLVIANPNDAAAPGTRVALDHARLALAAGAAPTALDDRPVSGGPGELTVDLEAHDFRLIGVGY